MAVTADTLVAACQTEFSFVGTSSRNVRQVAVTLETCTAACQTEAAAADDFSQHLADQTKTIAGLESARGRIDIQCFDFAFYCLQLEMRKNFQENESEL